MFPHGDLQDAEMLRMQEGWEIAAEDALQESPSGSPWRSCSKTQPAAQSIVCTAPHSVRDLSRGNAGRVYLPAQPHGGVPPLQSLLAASTPVPLS